MLAQRSDFPHAFACIRSSADEAAHGLILLNDDRDPVLEAELRRRGFTVLAPGRNLGVAAGRNLLFQEAAARRPEAIVVLDDDLVVPPGYVTHMADAVRSLRGEHDLGVVGPAVLNYRGAADAGLVTEPLDDRSDVRGVPDRDTLAARLGAGRTMPPSMVDHLGIVAWEDHYTRAHGPAAAEARNTVFGEVLAPGDVDGALRSRAAARSMITADDPPPLSVDTVAGGTWCFDPALLERAGMLDEDLGGFGYEDAEYCIRLRRLGFTNLVLTGTAVLHDPTTRAGRRHPAATYFRRNRFRGVLMRRHLEGRRLLTCLLETALFTPIELRAALARGPETGNGELSGASVAGLAGLLIGLGAPSDQAANHGGFDEVATRLASDAAITAHAGPGRLHAEWAGTSAGSGQLQIAATVSGSELVVSLQGELSAARSVTLDAAVTLRSVDGSLAVGSLVLVGGAYTTSGIGNDLAASGLRFTANNPLVDLIERGIRPSP